VRFKLNCNPRRSERAERYSCHLTNNRSIKADLITKRKKGQLYARGKIGRTGQKELCRLNDVDTIPPCLQALVLGMRLTNLARICGRGYGGGHSGCRIKDKIYSYFKCD
jgi:hypothetical protein